MFNNNHKSIEICRWRYELSGLDLSNIATEWPDVINADYLKPDNAAQAILCFNHLIFIFIYCFTRHHAIIVASSRSPCD